MNDLEEFTNKNKILISENELQLNEIKLQEKNLADYKNQIKILDDSVRQEREAKE